MARLYDDYYICKKCNSKEFIVVDVFNIRINDGEPNIHNPELKRKELRCDNCGSKIQDNQI